MFSTAVREIEDFNHNWKVFFEVINKDCLYFKNKICIMVVIIRDETKRILLNISITVNKIYNKWCSVQYSRVLARPYLMTLYIISPIHLNFPIRSRGAFKAIINRKK